MTRIDFYLLSSKHANASERTACRLAEKAYNLRHAIYIHTGSQQRTAQMDNLLWTFRDGSFIPHQMHGQDESHNSPVIIGHQTSPDEELTTHHQLLINLDQTVPSFFSRFERVAEIVSADEQQRQAARERFRFYRERGYELETHELAG
ncbi:MAG TPA: DNA polymerase III subunit chi [Gammaproteobacteria bacterium]|nr:DNA polymerase III subunit chi [Gammaproteobacteria bacterium]